MGFCQYTAAVSYVFPVLTFSLTHVSEKNLSSLSSRSVRRQKSVCSNGRTFLMATSLPVGICNAAATVPYAPSPRP